MSGKNETVCLNIDVHRCSTVSWLLILIHNDGLVGGALPVAHREAPHPKKPLWAQDKIAHNPLDSTCPLVKKGKQREVPKAKKPTPLKKVR